MMLGALIMLALTSPKLLVYVLVGTPLVIAPVVLLGRRCVTSPSKEPGSSRTPWRGDETIHAVRTVQAYPARASSGNASRSESTPCSPTPRLVERTSATLLSAIVVVLAFTGVSVILLDRRSRRAGRAA